MRFQQIYIYIFSLIFSFTAYSQNIIWANKVLKSTERFEYQDNFASFSIGLPSVYQGVMNEKIDPYTEGFVLHYETSSKKNIIKYGFPRVVGAEQLVLGGIFNLGVISSVKIIDLDNKEIEVYRMSKGSVSKFHNFNIFFEPMGVVGIKLEIDHTKINQWNLLKGIGLAESTDPIHPYPDMFDEDEFYGKEKVELTHEGSKCMVISPKLSHDGRKLYFVKECPNQKDQDIWIADLDTITSKWKMAQKAPFPLNNDGHNFVASIGDREKFLLLGNAYKADGSNAGDGVSISHKNPDGTWAIPSTINIPGLHNKNEHANFYLSEDEATLIMSVEDSSSQGQLDLCASFYNKETKSWSKPINFGPSINTFLSEDSPCLLEDGKTLFFSSKGYVGFGGHDLYVSKRLDDTWKNWSKPQNLGPLVNSKTDDFGFTISADGKHAYYNSFNFESDSLNFTDVNKINLPKYFYQEPRIVVSGTIKSEEGTGIDAMISMQNESGTVQSFYNSSGKGGSYNISISLLDKYVISVENENYYKKEIILTHAELSSIVGNGFLDLKLKSYPDSGYCVNLKNITFVKSSSVLTSASGLSLDSIAFELLKNPRAKIEIGGHTDNQGDPKKNKSLSLSRAKAVGAFLISKGISSKRINHKGYGAEKPILSNSTEQGRNLNQRVSITFLGRLSKDPL